ncbi:MAG: DinB family protein [Croceitalea sp.]|nr:DinB family protein [Croceitalea sp.]MBT8238819.1 DinB family protein [Croceitalea sp.]NNM19372.1 DinB family protein [Croceitalea sp.]
MENLFIIAQQNRKILYQYLKNTPKEALFLVPKGFNNNIWWNIAHVVVTQQKLVYGLSGLPLVIDDALVKKYEKGTYPKGVPNDVEFENIKKLLFSTIEQTKHDLENGLFVNFTPYMTTPKIPLNSVEDAIAFNMFHEGIHLGTIMALAKTIQVA